jgi:hypothetical protein
LPIWALVVGVLLAVPSFSSARHVATLYYGQDSDREHFRDGLVRAGLPD